MNQPLTEALGFNGIVDKVRAVRVNGEVNHLEATIHIKLGDEYKGTYGGEVTMELAVRLPVRSNVNPGHVVQASFTFMDPFGQRFNPALEMGQDEDDGGDDVLDVMVENSMIDEANEELTETILDEGNQ